LKPMQDINSNDPELNGKFLGTITADFIKVCDQLKEAAYQMNSRSISKYPVFILCREIQPIGVLLHSRVTEDLEWNYFFAMGEEFVERGILSEAGFENFAASFKDPDEFCCLFVVSPDFTNFVFLPYPED
jgi:hypothetical protein